MNSAFLDEIVYQERYCENLFMNAGRYDVGPIISVSKMLDKLFVMDQQFIRLLDEWDTSIIEVYIRKKIWDFVHITVGRIHISSKLLRDSKSRRLKKFFYISVDFDSSNFKQKEVEIAGGENLSEDLCQRLKEFISDGRTCDEISKLFGKTVVITEEDDKIVVSIK